MSSLTYNGITMSVVKVNGAKREAIYNGNSYQHTRWLLSVRATVNPFTVPYLMPGNPQAVVPNKQADPAANQFTAFVPNKNQPNNPAVVAGPAGFVPAGITPAGAIDQSIRFLLMSPRQKLTYEVGGQKVLVSPIPGFTVDAMNGPRPISCDIVQWIGPKTLLVDYVIETWQREDILFPGVRSPLASLTWEVESEMDEHFYTTNTIRGRAVFRSDLLAQQNISPDRMRNILFHPIPKNFKRDRVWVKLDGDGVTLNYVIQDKERALNYKVTDVTRIEARQWIQAGDVGIEQGATNVLKGFLGGMGKDAAGNDKGFGPPIVGALNAFVDSQPTLSHGFDIQVWGNRHSFRGDLMQLAFDLLSARLALFPNKWGGRAVKITHDLTGTYVHLEASITTGPLGNWITWMETLFKKNFILPGHVNAQSDDTGTILVANPATVIPPPPGDKGSRGTYLEVLAAQVLMDPFTTVTQPIGFSPIA
jgi:hypothetical protein